MKYRADNVEVNPFFLYSPAYCKKFQSISDRNSSIDFLSFIVIFKTTKDKMPVRVADFAPFKCLKSGAKTFPSGRVNFEVVKSLNFDWPGLPSYFKRDNISIFQGVERHKQFSSVVKQKLSPSNKKFGLKCDSDRVSSKRRQQANDLHALLIALLSVRDYQKCQLSRKPVAFQTKFVTSSVNNR